MLGPSISHPVSFFFFADSLTEATARTLTAYVLYKNFCYNLSNNGVQRHSTSEVQGTLEGAALKGVT